MADRVAGLRSRRRTASPGGIDDYSALPAITSNSRRAQSRLHDPCTVRGRNRTGHHQRSQSIFSSTSGGSPLTPLGLLRHPYHLFITTDDELDDLSLRARAPGGAALAQWPTVLLAIISP